MTNSLTRWLQRRELLGYFLLAFGISWVGILIVLAAVGFDLSPMQPFEAGLIFVAMLLGPDLRVNFRTN